jgi:hypothetical protein
MSKRVKTPSAGRVPGRRPGPEQRDEYLRIWDAVDDDHRKMLIFFARGMAQDAGLVPPNTPLLMTDRVF